MSYFVLINIYTNYHLTRKKGEATLSIHPRPICVIISLYKVQCLSSYQYYVTDSISFHFCQKCNFLNNNDINIESTTQATALHITISNAASEVAKPSVYCCVVYKSNTRPESKPKGMSAYHTCSSKNDWNMLLHISNSI